MKIHKNKVALISDLHIGVHQASTSWHTISLNFAQWLKTNLIENKIQDIIILGDVIDNRNEVSVPTLHILYKFFKTLEDFNIIILTGNHDCYYSKRSDVHSIGTLNDWPNIEVLDKLVTINQFGKNMTFCPWNTQLDVIPNCDVIFGHFEINTFKMNNSSYICEHGMNANDLLEKAPLILTGHFHSTEERAYKNGKILYTGSPYEQNWGEANTPKGIYLFDIQNNNLEFIENKQSPKHIKIRLSELLALGKITDTVKKEFEGNIINFIIDEEIEQKAVDTLLNKLYMLNPLSIKTENLTFTNNIISTDEEITFDGVDIKHDIIEYVNNFEEVENKQELINYLTTVYENCISEKA